MRIGLVRAHTKAIGRHVAGLVKALFRNGPENVLYRELPELTHPSQLCHCVCGPDGSPDQHDRSCAWLAMMCLLCKGHGNCPNCGGDGTDLRVKPQA